MHTVAGAGPTPWGGGQLPNPNKCNSTLSGGTGGEALTPNPNECNSKVCSINFESPAGSPE